MEIREIAISHYGPLRDVKHRPQPGLQVFYGPNESGKTMLIDAILKLMLGKRLKDFKDIDRVPGMPQGRVALAVQGKEYILDGKTLLEDVTGLSSSDMRNVFVIRNKDLQISGQADYFSQINDQLTGMEGRRLAKLKEIVRNQGRLTRASSAAWLSKSQDFDGIGDKVDAAGKLATEIREYLQQAKAGELDALEKRLEESRLRLQAINRQIQDQELAKAREEYNQLVREVEEYRLRSEEANRLLPYTKTKFMQLQDKTSRSKANKDTAEESQNKLTRLQPLLHQATAEMAESQIKMTPLEGRKLLMDNLIQQTQAAAETPFPPKLPLGGFGLLLLSVTGLSVFLAARDMLPGNLQTLPFWTLGAALVLLLGDIILRFRGHACRKKQQLLIQQGAALGIIAETIQELSAAADKERNSIDEARSRHQQLNEKIRSLESQKLYLEENIRAASILAAELEQDVKNEFGRLAVDNLEQFGELMEQYSKSQTYCDDLHQSLEAAFEQAPARTGDWQSLLQQLPIPPDPGVNYDAGKLPQLRLDKDRTLAEIDKLQKELSRHQSLLSQFAAACQALPLEKETGCKLPTQFADLEVLAYSATVLELFVSTVTQTFTAACGLMGILETLEAEEQEKMTDLVGPDKPVQEIFRTITGGKYTRVTLDSKLNIQAINCQGLELPASALSQGTYDQLYLALRLSLAQDLLGDKPAFLLLDDAFLCADSSRQEKMMALLTQLAEKGWQILYFTMDERMLTSTPKYTANDIIRLEPLILS
jgi:DNA repair exonuclease SbcCD ATPase subunit